MNGYVNPAAVRTYQQGQVTQADPVDLVVLLYEGAIQWVRQAAEGLTKNNPLASGIALYRALAILGELRRSLNPEAGGEIAGNLDALYHYMHEELVKGNLERRAERVEAVGTLLAQLRDAWAEAGKQVKAQARAQLGATPPVIPHDQTGAGAPSVLVKA